MATKSILKDVCIRNKHLSKNFTSALASAENKSSKPVVLSRNLEEIKGEDVRKFFGAN